MSLQLSHRQPRQGVGLVQCRGNAHPCRRRHNRPAGIAAGPDDDIRSEIPDDIAGRAAVGRGCRKPQRADIREDCPRCERAPDPLGSDIIQRIPFSRNQVLFLAPADADKRNLRAGGVPPDDLRNRQRGVDVPRRPAARQQYFHVKPPECPRDAVSGSAKNFHRESFCTVGRRPDDYIFRCVAYRETERMMATSIICKTREVPP